MPTIDSETLRLYAEMQAAARDGNLLSYANNLARSMMGEREPTTRPIIPLPREAARETVSNPATVRPPTPQPRSVEDRVQVRQV